MLCGNVSWLFLDSLIIGGIDVEGSNSVSMRSTTSDNAMDQIQAIIRNRCKTLLKTRQLKGYPMNLPFSDVDAVLEQIKAVGIHEIKATDVQFVLAVRAFPLVNNAISLWVFVGSLEVNHSK